MLKRVSDFLLAVTGFIVLLPIILGIAIIVKVTSPGPVFYRGVRTGLKGKPFKIFKFRTMVVDAENKGGHSTALNDPRLTKCGAFLRKYKLDELPQLINIIIGEMSFVGPRPQVEKYTRLYTEEEKIILTVRPGITDYASIRFVNLDKILGDEDVDEKYLKEIEPKKNRFRIKYAKEHTLWLDIKILIATIIRVFRIKKTWNIED